MLDAFDYDKLEQIKLIQKELLEEQKQTNKLLQKLLDHVEYIKNTK